mmetsp:Transcript_20027/g.59939  ORF Transcript_20027/g.59939 Transcript_20027/m.59939 type:complete len:230 (+) Transcript_20027:536-1225(+)
MDIIGRRTGRAPHRGRVPGHAPGMRAVFDVDGAVAAVRRSDVLWDLCDLALFAHRRAWQGAVDPRRMRVGPWVLRGGHDVEPVTGRRDRNRVHRDVHPLHHGVPVPVSAPGDGHLDEVRLLVGCPENRLGDSLVAGVLRGQAPRGKLGGERAPRVGVRRGLLLGLELHLVDLGLHLGVRGRGVVLPRRHDGRRHQDPALSRAAGAVDRPAVPRGLDGPWGAGLRALAAL